MRRKKEKEHKKILRIAAIALAVLGLVVAGVVCWSVIVKKVGPEEDLPVKKPDGYINCMPPLTEEGAELCERAKREGWDIAY